MNVEFTGAFALDHDTFGIRFEALVDGKSCSCLITSDALQDLDPGMASQPAVQQFQTHHAIIEQLARKKIEAGAVPTITTADLK